MSILKRNSEKLYDIIKRPLITEKSTTAIKSNQYSFEVVNGATKIEIKQAVELVFPGRKVKKVRTVYMPSHEKRLGKTSGRTQSGRKAIVTIEGEPIEELMGA
ncbi:MAG: 50S ribosomal protein L23 [Candidatus Gastranaerophilaceae bacterium]|jgi:large subunit ribosomal protein L23